MIIAAWCLVVMAAWCAIMFSRYADRVCRNLELEEEIAVKLRQIESMKDMQLSLRNQIEFLQGRVESYKTLFESITIKNPMKKGVKNELID